MEPILNTAWLTWDQKVQRPRVKPNNIGLKNQCSDKMTPNDWYSAIFIDQCLVQPPSVQPSPAADGNIEAHSQTLCREWKTLEHLSLSEFSPTNPSLQSSGNPTKKEAESKSLPLLGCSLVGFWEVYCFHGWGGVDVILVFFDLRELEAAWVMRGRLSEKSFRRESND